MTRRWGSGPEPDPAPDPDPAGFGSRLPIRPGSGDALRRVREREDVRSDWDGDALSVEGRQRPSGLTLMLTTIVPSF